MKILPINSISGNLRGTNTNFKGLWGKTTHNDYTESEHYIYQTIHEYYPFSDEKKEQIEKVKENVQDTKSSIPGKGYVADPWPHIDSVIVTVMAALPFTSREFLNYTMNRLPITKQRLIERHIASKGLSILRK